MFPVSSNATIAPGARVKSTSSVKGEATGPVGRCPPESAAGTVGPSNRVGMADASVRRESGPAREPNGPFLLIERSGSTTWRAGLGSRPATFSAAMPE